MRAIIFILTIIFSLLSPVSAQNPVIYRGFIEGDIDPGLSPYVKRVISEAEKNGAAAVVFEINTFGGRVDAATQIKDAILNSSVPTIAFINKRAISAGALIAISCQKVAMVPGASIGAATVVDQTGQKQAEKYQSYMRSEMRATAEKNGRNTKIAEGMVDERIVVEGLVDSTQLITLTSEQAAAYKIADTVATSLNAALDALGYKNAKIVDVGNSWAETFVRFLNNPIISSLLIMIGLVGIFTEIKTPGWGVAGTMALIALGLFFGSSLILELASWVEIILFVAGIILILVEIFLIPGFGVPGILGIVLMIGAIFFSLFNYQGYLDYGILYRAIIQLAGSLVGTIVILVILYKYLPKSAAFQTFVLNDSTSGEKGFISNPDNTHLIGMKGMTFTPLRPAGTVLIGGKRFDVVSQGDFIEKDVEVSVVRVEGVKIFVEKSE
ncbi:MAG: nodulation protein NfeD [Ignavibacteriaceae bacterium]|nr:nodulation protein NfeD [Ignavibacteriaceae bacterium]